MTRRLTARRPAAQAQAPEEKIVAVHDTSQAARRSMREAERSLAQHTGEQERPALTSHPGKLPRGGQLARSSKITVLEC